MRIAVVCGVIVRHDAISDAALEQVALLAQLPGVERVDLFSQYIEVPPPCDSHVLLDPWQLVIHPRFTEADVVILHWGIYYQLFDVVTLLQNPGRPRVVVHFHNCTPVELLPPSQHAASRQSMAQFAHAITCNVEYWTYSEFNRKTLLEWGVDAGHIRQVPIPIELPTWAPQSDPAGRVRFITVGRVTPAKGHKELLDAVEQLPTQVLDHAEFVIAGSNRFSDDRFVQQLIERVGNSERLSDHVTFMWNISDAQLFDEISAADVVISPSFHEGLCVPVIEGYAAGCRAIVTSAGNLPYLVLPGDSVVPPGDAAMLATSIAQEVRLGRRGQFEPLRRAVAERYSRASARAEHQSALFG